MTLSIVIPVYNTEKYLRKCLDSVIDSGAEVICVDDGSTDSSLDILKEYEGKITLFSQENKGVGAARNKGIEKAGGEYIAFLDSDDYYAENTIPEMLEELKNPVDILFFDFVQINEKGEQVAYHKGRIYDDPLMDFPSATNKVFKKSLFTDKGISFPSRVWFEDMRTVPKLYGGATMRYVPKGWYMYLQQSQSITHTNPKRNLEIIDACEDLLDYFGEKTPELEYMFLYNEVITSIDRVNLIDKNSDVQDRLLDWFLENFPDYGENRYFKEMPLKLKAIFALIIKRNWNMLNSLLRANNLVKGK